MDGNWINVGIWIITLVFTIGVQFGIYTSLQRFVKEKFIALSNKIMSLERSLDKKEMEMEIIRKDIHRSDLLLAEIKVMVHNIGLSLEKMENNTKQSIENLQKRMNHE
jgi:hypothetical protein